MFFKEIDRILKPNGTLAIWGYLLNYCENKEPTEIITKFFSETLGEYWSKRRKYLDNAYRDIQFPYSNSMEKEIFVNKKTMKLEDYINYVRTWSSFNQWKKIHQSEDILIQLEKE